MPSTQEKKRQGWGLVVLGQGNKAGTGWDCNRLAAVGCSEKAIFDNGLKEVKFSVWSQPEAHTVLSGLLTFDCLLWSLVWSLCAFCHVSSLAWPFSLLSEQWA